MHQEKRWEERYGAGEEQSKSFRGLEHQCVRECRGVIIIITIIIVIVIIIIIIPANGTSMLTVCQTQCVNYLINSPNNRLICAIT